MEPSRKLRDSICSHHDELLKIFCHTDQQSTCVLCSVGEHKGHDTVSAAAERTERQKQLNVSRQNVRQRIQDKEREVKMLQQEVEAIICSAAEAVVDSDKVFTELMFLLAKRRSDVKKQITPQQEAEVNQVQELQKSFEQEITEPKRKDAKLEQLSRTEDHNSFLNNYTSLSGLSEPTDSCGCDNGCVRGQRYAAGHSE